VGSARAQRFPRLSLSGSVFTTKSRTSASTQRFDTWTVGPLQLTVPLFDGGASEANVEAAKARYEDAAAQYRASVRKAVQEVEEALVKLQSTAERNEDALVAAQGYRASFTGTEARYRSGLASLVELEDARRTLLAAQSAVVDAAARAPQRLGGAVPRAGRRLDQRRAAGAAPGRRKSPPPSRPPPSPRPEAATRSSRPLS
jgi:multidrug efflux system outer membrane protein